MAIVMIIDRFLYVSYIRLPLILSYFWRCFVIHIFFPIYLFTRFCQNLNEYS